VTTEMMSDILEGEEEEEDADLTLAQLADELHLSLAFELPTAPTSLKQQLPAVPRVSEQPVAETTEVDALLARFEALKTHDNKDKDNKKPGPHAPPVHT